MSHACVYVGLGSNLDDPVAQLTKAFQALKGLPQSGNFRCSALYQSKAHGPEQPDYINACVYFTTELEPLAVLDALQAIENSQGRTRSVHWGARTLDLDLLLYDSQVFTTQRLTLPHPYLTERNFVVFPLFDLNPDLILPCGKNLYDLRTKLTNADLTLLPTKVIPT